MLENDKMETVNTEVLIRCRSNIEKFMRRTHRHFVDFESQIHVKISTSNRCLDFHVDSPFKIDKMPMYSSRGISTWNWWPIDEDVSIENLPSRDRMCQGCHLKFLTPKTYKGPSGNQYKIWWFDDKIVFWKQ